MLTALVLATRIATLFLTSANLGPDEAQYWYWSRTLDLGYFSKPPMIAWAIAFTTTLFGHEEWAVRLSAPFFHAGAAGFLFLLSRRLFDATTAFWTAAGWLFLPGVALSSFVITTDAPLLFFWCAGLYLVFDLAERSETGAPTVPRAGIFGAVIGLAFLAKYAALYFIAAGALAAFVDPRIRRVFLGRAGAAAGGAFATCAALNVWWNAQNDFQTVGHTAENANWGASLLQPLSLLEFWAGQLAVFGLMAPLAIWAFFLWRRRRDPRRTDLLVLLVFALTPLLIVSVQAFISRAHANWAASAYPAAILLVAHILTAHGHGRALKRAVALHGAAALAFCIAMVNFGLIDRVGASGAIREIRGWDRQTEAIAARASGFDAVMIDDRGLLGEMLYYQREAMIAVVAWDPNARVSNHYEAFIPFDPDRQSRVLFVTTRDDDAHVNYRFTDIMSLGPLAANGEGETAKTRRSFHLFDVSGYTPPPSVVETRSSAR
ncbi:MAG: glycosyltransferase family 39 protein [Pseudomonadota bacterium]